MYKFSGHLTNSHLFLIRKQLSNGRCAALIVMRAQHEQHYKERCPEAPQPKKSRKLLYGAIGATLLGGAAVVYAKNSPKTRNWLEVNFPMANDVIALVYQENQTYWQFTSKQFNKATRFVYDFLFGKEGITPMSFQGRSEQDLEEDARKAAEAVTFYALPPKVLEPLYVEEIEVTTPDVEMESTLVRTDVCEPKEVPKVHITKDIVEMERDMHEGTKIAMELYREAYKVCQSYTKALHTVIENPLEVLDKKHYAALSTTRNQRDSILEKAKAAGAKAKCAIDNLDRLIQAKGIQAPPEEMAMTKRFLNQFRSDLNGIETNVANELDKCVLADKYWTLVEAARGAYQKELEYLFPGVDLCERKLDVRGDTDLLLIYTMKQVQFLQNQLAELQTIRDLKLNKALECMDEKEIIDCKVEDMLKKDRVAREQEFQRKILQTIGEAEQKLRDALKKQHDIHQKVMASKIADKEKEVAKNLNRAVSEALEGQRLEFKKELAAMSGKLKAIEQTLKQRAAAEAEARRSQSVWAAAEALLAATRNNNDRITVTAQLNALEKAGKGDKLVETVLKGIPTEVKERPILTEKSVRDQFDVLEKTACKVALIGSDGASLPMYFLSWVQSKILFQKLAEIPQDELENQPTDFTDLDTFDIMQRARYHMDHGNLTNALRYVNLLQGAPRAAAKPWLEEARRHLEIKQAAETVMAHASLSGLLYL